MSGSRTDRWAIILGCSMGTGAAVARAVARNDALNVIGVHRGNHVDEAAALKADVEAAGVRCELLVADAGRIAHIDELVAAMGAVMGPDGRVALVLHSVADASVGPIVHPDPKRALHPKQILKTFEVMAHSFLFWGQRLFSAGLLAPSARILALLNTMDSHVAPAATAIGASKAALGAYVRYMADELGPHGIRVNAVRFGASDTYAFSRVPGSDVVLSNMRGINPLGRNVDPADVASFVSLLLDPRAASVNGAILNVDGGEESAFGHLVFKNSSS